MSTADRNCSFLVTTALEDFWDASMPMLYLGEWCCRFSRRNYWEKLPGQVMKSPWTSLEVRLEAMRVCDAVCERLIIILGEALNAMHSRQHSNRYWRILLEPWLSYYVAAMYDYLIRMGRAIEANPELISLGLSEESFVLPVGTAEFARLMKEDPYNLQLFTRVMRFIGISLTMKNYPVRDCVPKQTITVPSWRVRAKQIADVLLRSLGSRQTVLLRSSYFPRHVELHLFGRPGRSVRRLSIDPPRLKPLPVDPVRRLSLRSGLPGYTRFEQLLRETLPLHIPPSCVEGYGARGEQTRNLYRDRPRAIFTENAHYYDDVFKRFAAAAADRGTLLLGIVHGTRMGAPAWMRAEEHETRIFDRYYSWGWEKPNCHARVVPMPAGKLIGRAPIGADNRREGILWATTTAPRYLREFPFVPEQFSVYLEWQQRFFAALDPTLKPHARLRPHHEDQGWDIVARLKHTFPSLRVETWKIPFMQSLRKCRLYVCDHCSTTFGEALSADKPTVLFWNYDGNELRAEAQPYFDALRSAGILYYDPVEAAACVNRVYGDVEAWWNDPGRQRARRLFCHRFARTSDDAIGIWSNEFRQVLESVAHPAGGSTLLASHEARSAD